MVATHSHADGATESFGPWNPGITSQLTPELWRMCTIFRPENVFTTYEQAVEFRELTGLPLPQLVVFRPERLVLHEVLVRLTPITKCRTRKVPTFRASASTLEK